jgi:hypothetical protein
VKEEVGDITVPETEEEEMEPELENSLKMMGEEEKKASPMVRLWVSWDKKIKQIVRFYMGKKQKEEVEKMLRGEKRMRRRRGREGDEIVILSQRMLNKQ